MGDRDARVFVIARVLSLRTGSHTSTRSHIRRRARGGARADDEGEDRSSRSAVLVVRAVPLIADDERAMRRSARRHRQSLSSSITSRARTIDARIRDTRSIAQFQSPICATIPIRSTQDTPASACSMGRHDRASTDRPSIGETRTRVVAFDACTSARVTSTRTQPWKRYASSSSWSSSSARVDGVRTSVRSTRAGVVEVCLWLMY